MEFKAFLNTIAQHVDASNVCSFISLVEGLVKLSVVSPISAAIEVGSDVVEIVGAATKQDATLDSVLDTVVHIIQEPVDN